MQDIPRHLIEKAAEGDMIAFETIYKISSSYVYTLALKVTRNTHDAEEVTQDVFVRIHRSLKDFRFASSFKTWIYRIAVNSALNMATRRSKVQTRTVDDEDAIDGIGVPPDAGRNLERDDAKLKLDLLLSNLKPDHRACLVLREIHELNYQEIADVLKINLNTVRSRLKRARQALLILARAKESLHGL